MYRSILTAALILSSSTLALASPVADRVNGALHDMKQKAGHLETVLTARNMPPSVVAAPHRTIRQGLKRDLGPRLRLGLTSEPQIQVSDNHTTIVASGSRDSRVEAMVHMSAAAGTRDSAVAKQFVQSTAETTQTTPRDPRHGVEADTKQVRQWKTAGVPIGNGWVQGPGKLRTITPLSPGLPFRGGRLHAGSHLVTVESGENARLHFNAGPPLPSGSVQNAKTRTYLLKANSEGKVTRVRLTDTEVSDLRANAPHESFHMEDGQVKDNPARGYDSASLQAGSFTP